jgi:misacylated tRNA(Ala) deacylase
LTEIIAHKDAYLRETDSTVVAVRPEGVVVDSTVFYPGGGGQPADSGVLVCDGREYRVTALKRIDGAVGHLIASEPTSEPVHSGAKNDRSLIIGDLVHGVVDWPKRYELMRTHTALHILCGVIWRDLGVSVTGGNMKPLAARMDFELAEMSSDFAEKIEEAINKEVAAERDIVVGLLPRDEAFAVPDLIRTKINLLPPGIVEVRTVEIVGLDLQADGGTHVANTREVGRIRVVGHESKGKGNKRLRIALDLE